MKSTNHSNMGFRRSGLVVHPNLPYLGATPDGRYMYTCDCHGEGIVEVKCPYKYKDADPEDLLGNADVMVDRNLNINQSHKHYAQVQLQKKLCQVSVCDLVIWTTQRYLNLLIDFDQEFCDDMINKAQAFFMRAVLPSIIFSTHKSTTHKSSTDQLYCSCQEPEYGNMIACENENCDIEWYHFNCAGITSQPSGKWYCPECSMD